MDWDKLKTLRVVFMGSPQIAVKAFLRLHEYFTVVGVVTQPDRPAGRGKQLQPSAMKAAAQAAGISVLQPEKLSDPAAFATLQEWNPDVIVVMAYGQILRKNVLELPRYGCINIHASILPRWRGASPIQHAILAGDDMTGITIMKMDRGMDTGPMCVIYPVMIDPSDTADSLSEKIADRSGEVIHFALEGIVSESLQPIPQPEDGITYAPLLQKEEGLLDFARPAAELERKVRAFHPWPSAYFPFQDGMMKVLSAEALPDSTGAHSTHTRHNGFPAVVTGEGLLVLRMVQPPNRKPMDGKSFLAGFRTWEKSE